MATIYVKTTDTCNLNCSHCFTSGRLGKNTPWDWQATQAWVEEYRQRHPGPLHLELHGGEPFLVPLATLEAFCAPFLDLPEVSIGATTNLVYKLYPEHLAFFQRVLGSRIGTSWDINIRFETAAQYDLWRKNVRTVLDAGIYIKLFISITKEVVAMSAKDFIARIVSFGVPEIALERLTSSGSAIANPAIFPDNDLQDRWYLALLKEYQQGQVPFVIRDFDILEERVKHNVVRTYTNCRDCEQKLVTISADGSLAACPNAALENQFGTVTESVEHFLTHEGRLQQIAEEQVYHDQCLSCDVFSYCGGDCHRLSWHSGRCGGLKHTLRYLVHGTEPDAPRKPPRRFIPIQVIR